MAYLYILAATVTSSLLVIILKMIKMRGLDATVSITVNYVVMAAATLALSPVGVSAKYAWNAPWMGMAAVIGILFMVSFVVYALSAQRSGVAITTIAGRAAMAIPVIFAFVVLGEEPTVAKIVLLVVILGSMLLILAPDAKGTGKRIFGAMSVVLPLAVFLMNGVNDTMIQFTQKRLVGPGEEMLFLGTVGVVATLTGLVYYLVENRGRMPVPSGRAVWWGVILGVTNAICCVGMLYALKLVDGSVFYPLYYSGAVVLSTLIGVLFFGERLSWKNYTGIVVALAAIVLLAII